MTPAATLIVTRDDAVAGFVPKVPVMPVGQPDVARVTAELKPFAGVTVTVEVPLAPTLAVAAVALSVKLGGVATAAGGPRKIPLTTGFSADAVTVMFTLPLIFHRP